MRFQALDLSKLANQLITKTKGHQYEERNNDIHDKEDQEYKLGENGDDDLLNMRKELAAKNIVLVQLLIASLI